MFHRFRDIMPDYPPKPVVRCAYMASDRAHGHLPHKGHNDLLKQKSEAAAQAAPRDTDPVNAVFFTDNAGNTGFQEAIMLEEIQVTPRHLLKIMCVTQFSALWAGVQSPTIGTYFKEQVKGILPGIKGLSHQPPWRRQTKTKGKDGFGFHQTPPQARLSAYKGFRQIPQSASKSHKKTGPARSRRSCDAAVRTGSTKQDCAFHKPVHSFFIETDYGGSAKMRIRESLDRIGRMRY
jgi:hypothetical protein